MTEPRRFEDELRMLLDAQLDPRLERRAIASARTRIELLLAEDAAPTPSRVRTMPSRRSRIRVALVAATVAVVAIAAALATGPFGARDAAVPTLAADATAAETMQWAGDVLVRAPGSGSVLHSTQVTSRAGELVEVEERWIDTGEHRHRTILVRFDAGQARAVDLYEVDAARGFQRSWVRIDGVWQAPPQLRQSDEPFERPAPLVGGSSERVERLDGGGMRIVRTRPASRSGGDVSIEDATRTWIAAVARDRGAASLVDATRAFQESTRGFFAGVTDDDTPETRNATTIRQLVHLLSSAPVSSDAARFLYGELADFDELQRLDDATRDGRRVARIQFTGFGLESVSDGLFPGSERRRELERMIAEGRTVLLVDLEDGRLVGTESLDGSTRSLVEDVERVERLGEGRATCSTIATDVPCSLLDGTHPAARAADAIAAERS